MIVVHFLLAWFFKMQFSDFNDLGDLEFLHPSSGHKTWPFSRIFSRVVKKKLNTRFVPDIFF